MELAREPGMPNKTMATIVCAALLACAAPLRAQRDGNQGIWLSAGAGAGWVRVSCDICQTSRDFGPSAFVRAGTVITSELRAALEATAWTHEVEDDRENLGAAMAVLLLQPRHGAVHVKAGIGYVGYRAGDFSLNTLGMQLGAGYELRLGGVALTNYANLIGSSFGSLKNENTTVADDVSTSLLQFGFGLTLR